MVGGLSRVGGIYGTMADAGDVITLALEMQNQNQQTLNVWYYRVNVAPQAVPIVGIAEAWWNHVKDAYRALALGSYTGHRFLRVHARDAIDPLGEAASWEIPTAERVGTRVAIGDGGQALPPFIAATARLNVATRATRSGSKRFPFLLESDSDAAALTAGFAGLVGDVLLAAATSMILGAPAALVELYPVVYGKGVSDPPVYVTQDVVSYSVNPNVSTQNSRKMGRGA